jgi:iron complex transport system substrate-binding protein
MFKKTFKNIYKKVKCAALISAVTGTFFLTGCVDQHSGNAQNGKENIVATSVAVCEILDALEVENVIGVPSTESYEIPTRFESAANIGSPMSPDMEVIKSLNPSLILSPASLEGDLAAQYESIGINSAFLNLTSVQGMYKSIEELGELLSKQEQAEKLVLEFENFMSEYRRQSDGKTAPRVLILMGLPGSYVVATPDSYVGSLVELAGGINVYESENGEAFLNANTEDMATKQPDIILRTSHAMPQQVAQMFEEEFNTNDIWKHFDAVTNGRVYDLDSSLFGMSANFQYGDALLELQKILYDL